MEIIVIFLLLILITLVVFAVLKMTGSSEKKETLEAVLNAKFIDFSDRIRQTMDKTREEVEKSKDFLSKNALKTLEHITGMNEVVGSLVKQQEKAQELGKSLEYLLQTPKLRGSYGETVLEEMLDRILPKGIWEKQYVIADGERVDAVVKYKDIIIPIDAKFPKEDYQKYLTADSEHDKKIHWVNYEKALKIQINAIKEKYVKPEKGTSEFALLFIPSESMYYETIAEKNHLGDPCQIYEYATEKKVMPVSPNTFYAFLQIVMLGIRNIEIARDAKKLQESLSKVERDFNFFYNKFEIIGRNLEKATDAYKTGDGHIKRFKRTLDSTLNFDETLKVDSKEELIGT